MAPTTPAFAEESDEAASASAESADDSSEPPPAAKPKKKRKKVELTGRIFTRAALLDKETAADWTGQTTLQSARGGVDYHGKDLHAQLELEVAGKPRVKDAYAQLRLVGGDTKLDLRAGHFKMPFSAIQLESIWTLPQADRGLIDNILTRRMQIAGRAYGAMLMLNLGDVEVRGGMFQGRNDVGDVLAAPGDEAFGQDAVVRATYRPSKGIEIGTSGSARSGQLLVMPVAIEHAYAADVDAVLEQLVGPGRVRAWLEAMIGTSWITGGMIPGHDRTRFLETRGIGAYRLGGVARRDRYVEFYALAGYVDPDRIIDRDGIIETSGGITYGAHDVWRVQLEAEHWTFGDNAPLGIADFATLPEDSTTFLMQLGAHL